MLTIQVVGYKNSGKTTLVCELIKIFSKDGLKIASLKHHGHGGAPVSVENTDTAKHEKAGAIMTGVEGEGVFQLSIKQHSWKMEQLLAFYHICEIDLLIIEGFKEHDFEKIVLIRDEEDLHLLKQLSNIKVILTSLELNEEDYDCPILNPTDYNKLSKWLLSHLFTV
ncbi:molybdopterin-guanine dinucleotide biosynthesis protein B [Lottiidibacillus patelloidae]|uniref:Molybdopterin-guanine dinucleotide biosynthesis protein B n=1 Tax=Lottiidibacillus patelloidae TaxID=2670334 RepID=A0A263BSC6_9BACI|nr:molybdopterin-guanine dinucleotide biosynthesis protein B [Lottiidibacillus patelloidae]OZM56620.1 molybdopterin-guanine dinucleotide biosynthesis protein B [Lottiidibacillus patelloidae]